MALLLVRFAQMLQVERSKLTCLALCWWCCFSGNISAWVKPVPVTGKNMYWFCTCVWKFWLLNWPDLCACVYGKGPCWISVKPVSALSPEPVSALSPGGWGGVERMKRKLLMNQLIIAGMFFCFVSRWACEEYQELKQIVENHILQDYDVKRWVLTTLGL